MDDSELAEGATARSTISSVKARPRRDPDCSRKPNGKEEPCSGNAAPVCRPQVARSSENERRYGLLVTVDLGDRHSGGAGCWRC